MRARLLAAPLQGACPVAAKPPAQVRPGQGQVRRDPMQLHCAQAHAQAHVHPAGGHGALGSRTALLRDWA